MNLNAYSPDIVIGACAVVVLVLILLLVAIARQRNRKRTAELREQFGPEYDLALRRYGSRRKAEAELLARQRRVGGLALRPLSTAERDRFLQEWDSIQARFVDHPRGAVTEADEMITGVLRTCGYSATDFEQRTADLSVHHSRLVEPYRRASAITVKAGKNEATTEELRSGLLLYRAVLESLLQTPALPVRSTAAAA